MSIYRKIVILFLVCGSQGVVAERFFPEDVEVEIVNDRGYALSTFAVPGRHQDATFKAYLEARPQQRYAIQITNHSAERVGLVIAVDGRNIISGARSKLKSKERKYVLGPYQQATYRGWRSSRNHVNKFYFTNEDDSYSAAFGDYSAMGVIAVAVFRDADRFRYEESHEFDRDSGYRRDDYGAGKKNRAPSTNRLEKRSGEAAAQPGTGYGEERYSRARQVKFREERHASAKFLIKYEWRETLCRMGIKDCYRRGNRLWNESLRWDHHGFAPPPRKSRSFSRYFRLW